MKSQPPESVGLICSRPNLPSNPPPGCTPFPGATSRLPPAHSPQHTSCRQQAGAFHDLGAVSASPRAPGGRLLAGVPSIGTKLVGCYLNFTLGQQHSSREHTVFVLPKGTHCQGHGCKKTPPRRCRLGQSQHWTHSAVSLRGLCVPRPLLSHRHGALLTSHPAPGGVCTVITALSKHTTTLACRETGGPSWPNSWGQRHHQSLCPTAGGPVWPAEGFSAPGEGRRFRHTRVW